jgi:uncharacterized membrane protein
MMIVMAFIAGVVPFMPLEPWLALVLVFVAATIITVIGVTLELDNRGTHAGERDDFRNGVVNEILSIMHQIVSDPTAHDIRCSHWVSRTKESRESLLGHEDHALLKTFYETLEERDRYFGSRRGFSVPVVQKLNHSCLDRFSEVYSGILWVRESVAQTNIDNLLSRAKSSAMM